jgi:Lrp/AsnC family leucine-responsive transcriptional regulator
MATKISLDTTDRRILSVLSTDGRSSYQSIADAVGLSRPAVMERVKRLEESGYITGYGAHLDRGKLGFPVTAFVAVRYGNTASVGDEPRMRELARHAGVLECHHVAGEDCYIVKVVAPDLEGVQEVLRTMSVGQKSFNTRTTIVLSTLFEKPGLLAEGKSD